MSKSVLDWLPCHLLEAVDEAIIVTDAQLDAHGPSVVHANGAWERLSGLELTHIRGQPIASIQTDAASPMASFGRDELRRLLDGNRDGLSDEAGPVKLGVSPWMVEALGIPGSDPLGLAFTHRSAGWAPDMGAADALDVIRELQRLIDHSEPDLATAREQVAEAAQYLTSAEAAAVEEPDGDAMVYTAAVSNARGMEGLRLPIDGSASGHCYASSQPLLIGDTLDDARVQHRQAAIDLGFRSGVIVPLLQRDQRFGVLKVFSSLPNRFGRAEWELLDILAGVLTAVLYRARSYEIECEHRRQLVDALPMLVAYLDADRRYREVNAAYADWFGKPVREILGQSVWQIIGMSAYEQIRPYMDRVFAEGEALSYEETVTYPDDSPRVISVDYSPHVLSDGTVAGLYALVRDVTKARAADRDYLTGLPNRRRFDEEAHRQLEISRRYARPLSLILADVDDFKSWNDTWGHQTGDRILGTISAQMRDAARATDLVARWGGEELVILAPETDLNGAATLAERIRHEIATTTQPEGQAVTVSFGVAQLASGEASLRSLTRAADDALYAAKQGGRNCVVCSAGPDTPAVDEALPSAEPR